MQRAGDRAQLDAAEESRDMRYGGMHEERDTITLANSERVQERRHATHLILQLRVGEALKEVDDGVAGRIPTRCPMHDLPEIRLSTFHHRPI